MSKLRKWHKVYIMELIRHVETIPDVMNQFKDRVGTFGLEQFTEARQILNDEAIQRE